MRQTVLQAEILTITGRVLTNEVDLANIALVQPYGFVHHRLKAPAAKPSSILRDYAESAGMIAAFGDLDIGVVMRRRQHPRGQVVIKVRSRPIVLRLHTFAQR